MRLFTSGIRLLGALSSFSLVAHSRDVDPTEDFCSVSRHMSRASSSLLECFISLTVYLQMVEVYSGRERRYALYCGWSSVVS